MVEPAARLLMHRPNAVPVKDGDSELYLAFESKEEREQWTMLYGCWLDVCIVCDLNTRCLSL